MIAQEQEQATCKICGTPITQKGGKGHPKRVFCDKAKCRKAASRAARKGKQTVTVGVTIDAQAYIAELEQELARYRQIAALMDRAKMEARFMDLGKQVQYHPLTPQGIMGGFGYWQDFMRQAKDEDLLKAIAAAEYYLEGLVALRGDPQQRRITELEREKKDLQARLESEADTRVREFKIWLRSHPQPTDTTFFKRLLDDRDIPSKASQSMYLARLRSRRYSDEDIELFRDAWKRMLFNQP